ncbi:MAG: FtsX-like permease family protein [Ilumatobacteraceae bacterium]
MGKRYSSAGSRVPVAMASVLIAVCIVGARLYSSSVASAGLAEQVSETCRSASALVLPIYGDVEATENDVRELAEPLVYVEPVRRGAFAPRPLFNLHGSPPRRISLLWLEGIETQVTPNLKPLATGEIAVSETQLFQLQLEIGEVFTIGGQRVTVAQVFDDVAIDPLPEFFCGYSQLFMPTPGGDPPPPNAIASLETIAAVGALVFDEYQITSDPLTMTQADQLQDGYAKVTEAWNDRYSQLWGDVPRNELGSVLERARSVRTTVDRNLNPVLLIGLLADLVVLIAAGVLVARERRKELRLLAVRGVHPARIGLSVVPGLAASVIGGSVAGFGLAWLGVGLFGPSSLLERSALIAAGLQLVVAAIVATIVVATVVAKVADSYADPRRSRVGTTLPRVAAAAALVALSVVAFRRLDEKGGVRSSGVFSSGGDLLAMGFPLFAMLAVITLAGLVVMWVAPRVRLTGKRLWRGVRLGWRRVVLEAGPLAAIVMSVALAAGCFIVAVALSDGAHLQLQEKSQVYVGTDLAVTVFDEVTVPEEWRDQTSFMSKLKVKEGDHSVDLIGVDPATLTNVAHLRGDGASKSLDELLAAIDGPVTADGIATIAVGADAQVGDLVSLTVPGADGPVVLHIVETASFFPSKKSTVPMYVMTDAHLREAALFPITMLLISDPPDGAVESLRDSGVRTGLILDAESSFDGSAYSALRWAYVPLAALGVLFAVVALSLQLLVITARREQRRIAHALMVRTGFRRKSAFMAAVVETGVPLFVGTALGATAAIGAASLSIPRLDPMPLLDPAARFLVPWSVLAFAGLIVAVWTVVIAFSIVRSTERSDPMRVFHGAP